MELQSKLLCVLQEQEFYRLGNALTIRGDFCLVAATSRDLPRLVEEDSFRIDLYYRLNVFAIEAPPLRDRMEDIPPLCGTLSENMPSVRKSGSKLFSQKIWKLWFIINGQAMCGNCRTSSSVA